MKENISVVMLGASGAVGGQVLATMRAMPTLDRISLLGRRNIALHALPTLTESPERSSAFSAPSAAISQHRVDVGDPESYARLLPGHEAAVCTLGVGEPSKMGRADFVRIDRDGVIAFAAACKAAGVCHFELLSAVGADAQSRSFYLRTKGELQEALVAMNFERLSLFQPSMILTPSNRYGVSQALTLAVWPRLTPLLRGGWRKFRGIPVNVLGAAMARNVATTGRGVEALQWDDFLRLESPRQP
jgi:uncharacterized protein YbjT (DUF2867 family)